MNTSYKTITYKIFIVCVSDIISFVLFYFLIGITCLSVCVYVIGKCFNPVKPSIGNSHTYILINLLKDKFKNSKTWYIDCSKCAGFFLFLYKLLLSMIDQVIRM